MISKEFAVAQVGRLGQMLGFPASQPEAAKELVFAVQAAETEDIARAAVSAVLDGATGETRCPMPAELRGLIWAENGKQKTAEPQAHSGRCPHCNGAGYEIVERGGLTGARICRCKASTQFGQGKETAA